MPTKLFHKSKAQDTAAKSQVTTMQTAVETYATDHSGSYADVLAERDWRLPQRHLVAPASPRIKA